MKKDYNKIKKVLLKVKDFKKRGCNIVKDDLKQQWVDFIDSYLKDKNKILYNGIIIDASIKCMEDLTSGLSTKEIYESINEVNPLSSYQNYYVSNIVFIFHERGKEYRDYRNRYIQDNSRKNLC